MSKASKLFRHPILYWRDAIAKRKNGGAKGAYEEGLLLREAGQFFHNGKVAEAATTLSKINAPCAKTLFLKATMDLFAGRFENAEKNAYRSMLKLSPQDALFKDAFYLRVDSLRAMGRYADAQVALANKEFDDVSNRYFRALRLASSSKDDVYFYKSLTAGLHPSQKEHDRAVYNYSLLLRDLGEHEEAIQIARDRFIRIASTERFGSKKSVAKNDWTKDGEVALADLKHDLTHAGIDFFLVSGLVLGCVREGKIIGHDKDIDVGVDERYPLQTIKDAMANSPRFRIREIPSDHSVYVQHANGVIVDIFRHYLENGRYYHQGPKVKWWNTPFKTVEVNFLGGQYAIPEDIDTYLTENYGNWRTPNAEFETFVDTPNMEIGVEGHLLWYYVTKLSDYHRLGKMPQFIRVWNAYSRLRSDPCIEQKIALPLMQSTGHQPLTKAA